MTISTFEIKIWGQELIVCAQGLFWQIWFNIHSKRENSWDDFIDIL